ncbi:serine/threonine protein kinase, CMGC, CDC2/CDK sub [Gonapodya sp. JEL0774]|nr:serine/threonine protein kinase, CMGC, CDC2/CDK sub [Gonapodya sp. JEL0774]
MSQRLPRARFGIAVAVLVVVMVILPPVVVLAGPIAWANVSAANVSRPNPIPLPKGNQVLLGAHLDWDWDQPINVSRRLGLDLPLFSIFLPFPLDETAKLFINKTVETKPFPENGIMTITLEPSSVAALYDSTLNDGTSVPDVVEMVKKLNELGVPVILRFAHEMNGWWSTWAWRPTFYRAAFRAVALAVQACPTCNTTALLWAPQVGTSFPWGIDVNYTSAEWLAEHPDYAKLNMTEVALLDSNGNGLIDYGDEPYLPFYPGDDVVDIVGLSIYYTGSSAFGDGSLPQPNIFNNSIRGIDPIDNITVVAPSFYDLYAANKNKPFALAETSVMGINPGLLGKTPDSPTWLQVKQAWWRQTVSAAIFDQFPMYQYSWTFEFVKEDTLPGVTIDFGYTVEPTVAAAFRADLPLDRIPVTNVFLEDVGGCRFTKDEREYKRKGTELMESENAAASRKRPLAATSDSLSSDAKRPRQDPPSSSPNLANEESGPSSSGFNSAWIEDSSAPLPPRPNAPERRAVRDNDADGADEYSFSPLPDDLWKNTGSESGDQRKKRDGSEEGEEGEAIEEDYHKGDGREFPDAEEGELPYSPPYEGPGAGVGATDSSISGFAQSNQNGNHIPSGASAPVATDFPPLIGVTPVSDYDLFDTVGEGTFGVVRVGKEKSTGRMVALKRIIIPENSKDGFPVTALRELSLLKSLRHPNILRLLSIAVSPSSRSSRTRGDVHMVFDYYPHDLAGLLENPEVEMDLAQVKMYMRQVMEGMKYLHANNVMHRDIKTANILVSDSGLLKLADFGLARPLDSSDRNREYTDQVVTRWYRPPELLMESTKYDQAVDMWGVGKPIFPGRDDLDQLTCIFLTTGTPTDDYWPGFRSLPLFRRNPDIINLEYRRSMIRERFGRFGKGVVELLSGLLEVNPERRSTAEECLKHWWFSDKGGKETEIGSAAVAKGDVSLDPEVQQTGGEGIKPVTDSGKARYKSIASGNTLVNPHVLPPMAFSLGSRGLAELAAPTNVSPERGAEKETAAPTTVSVERRANEAETNLGVGEPTALSILKPVEQTMDRVREDQSAEAIISLVSGIGDVVDKVVTGFGELVE